MKKEKSIPHGKSLLLRASMVLLSIALAPPLSAAVAAADAYPSKPVRLIIAFAPGGSTDIVARMIGAKLSERLGKQVIPDNRGGGGGTIGMEMVAKAEPDGYTLLFSPSTRVSLRTR